MDTNYIIETKNLDVVNTAHKKSVADLNIHVKRGRYLRSAGQKRSRKNHDHENAVAA